MGKNYKKKKKQYNLYKVFRLKRKTLIIIVRKRVKTICSQTSFGEHNSLEKDFYNFHWKSKKQKIKKNVAVAIQDYEDGG